MAAAARGGQIYIDHATVGPGLNRRRGPAQRARRGFPGRARFGGSRAALRRARSRSWSAVTRPCSTGAASATGVRQEHPTVWPGRRRPGRQAHQPAPGWRAHPAIAEAAVFGAKLGGDPQVVLELIGTSFGGSAMMTRNMPRFMSRDFSGATPVGLILKDLGLIHDEAKPVASHCCSARWPSSDFGGRGRAAWGRRHGGAGQALGGPPGSTSAPPGTEPACRASLPI